ncbi:hypothetical protein A2U01_0094775, partial [Trifolium medium]|nr:hypothetical protein [Trifolium medium]
MRQGGKGTSEAI